MRARGVGRSIAAFVLPLLLVAGVAQAAQRSTVDAGWKTRERRVLSSSFQVTKRKPIAVAFFDADMTLRRSKSGRPSAQGYKDVELLPGVAHKIRQLNRRGVLVAIVSNQAGIPRHVSLEDAQRALSYTAHLLAKRGARVDYIDFAENRDEDRKPGIGMATRLDQMLQTRFGVGIDRARSFMVGDAGWARAGKDGPGDVTPRGKPGADFSGSDRGFAEAFGIPYHHAPGYFTKRQ